MLDGRIVADTGSPTQSGGSALGTPGALGAMTEPILDTHASASGTSCGRPSVGLRTRKLRAGLSALGIAIGVASIVAVLGLSSSSQAGLLAEIDKLGTNLLVVTNGQTFFGQTAELSKRRRP